MIINATGWQGMGNCYFPWRSLRVQDWRRNCYFSLRTLKCLTEAAPDVETGYWFSEIQFGKIFPDDRFCLVWVYFISFLFSFPERGLVQYYANVEVLNSWTCSVLCRLLWWDCLMYFIWTAFRDLFRYRNKSKLQGMYLFSHCGINKNNS